MPTYTGLDVYNVHRPMQSCLYSTVVEALGQILHCTGPGTNKILSFCFTQYKRKTPLDKQCENVGRKCERMTPIFWDIRREDDVTNNWY